MGWFHVARTSRSAGVRSRSASARRRDSPDGLRRRCRPIGQPVCTLLLSPGGVATRVGGQATRRTCLFASALNYVNVCPAFLKNAPARGSVKASVDGRGLEQCMHGEALAAFMVGQLRTLALFSAQHLVTRSTLHRRRSVRFAEPDCARAEMPRALDTLAGALG